MDLVQIATATTSLLSPFLPDLLDIAKTGGKKMTEAIAQKGGEAAWNTAQTLWKKLRSYFKEDPEFNSASVMVAAKPEDESRREMLAEVLSARLSDKPELAQEIMGLIGGQQ